MTDPTPEQIALWTRLCAEAEGYSVIQIEGFCALVEDAEAHTKTRSYRSDLNALQRVCVEIRKTEEGKLLLHQHLFHWVVDPELLDTSTLCAETICLPAEELFPIVGKVLEQLNITKEQL